MKTSSSTGGSGQTALPPIGNSFMYLEKSVNNSGDNVYVSCEKTDVIQITNKTFY